MAFCCQLLLLPRPAASRYAMLPPLLPQQQQWWQRQRQRSNLHPRCCGNHPPLRSSSSSALSFPFSSPAALSAGRRSPAFNAQWLVVACSCPLPSLSSPAIQRSLIIVSPAAGRRRISLLALRSRRGRSLRRRHGRRRRPVGGHEAMAEDQLVLQR
jgi:hypothetical protein